ncbi:hypothetical protein J6590_066880 [Homalodisca vitripennis]|nr:hypothetical protein J6590_066880 [Homalodisca vitripennis]
MANVRNPVSSTILPSSKINFKQRSNIVLNKVRAEAGMWEIMEHGSANWFKLAFELLAINDPALASSPPARPLVVVRKSPLSRWSPEYIQEFRMDKEPLPMRMHSGHYVSVSSYLKKRTLSVPVSASQSVEGQLATAFNIKEAPPNPTVMLRRKLTSLSTILPLYLDNSDESDKLDFAVLRVGSTGRYRPAKDKFSRVCKTITKRLLVDPIETNLTDYHLIYPPSCSSRLVANQHGRCNHSLIGDCCGAAEPTLCRLNRTAS